MAEGMSSNEALLALEQALREKLNPVRPDQNFVVSLRKRLEESPAYNQQRRLAATMLTIATGLLVGLVVFLIGRNFIQETG